MTEEASHNDHKLSQPKKKTSTKAKRIAQVLPQAEIGTSSKPTTARNEPREIQTQQ